MNIKNKLVAALAMAFLVVPTVSLAQTPSASQLQAEIQSLLAQIKSLQSGGLVATTTPTTTTSVRVSPVLPCSTLNCNGPVPIAPFPPIAPTSTVTIKFAVLENTALGNQTVTPNTTSALIGSYAFSAGSTEGVNINTIDVKVAPNATGTSAFQNLKLVVNGVQFGATQSVIGNNAMYAFSASPLSIPAASTVVVNVYADVLFTAKGSDAPATAIAGYSGAGAVSYTSISSTSTVNGQTVTFAGAPALTVSTDASDPQAGQIVQNSIGNTLAVFRLNNNSTAEPIVVSRLNLVAVVSSTKTVKAAFSNVGLWSGSVLLGVAAVPVADAAGTGYIYTFNTLTTPLVIPTGNSVSLAIRGDAGSWVNGSLTDGSTFTFEIATTTDSINNTSALAVVARGQTSNLAASVTLANAKGNTQQVVRTTLAVAAQSVSAFPPASFQQIGSITLTAYAAGDAVMNALKLTTNQSNATFLNSLSLRDPGGNDIVSVGGFAKYSASGNAGTWTFARSTKPLDITAGSSYTLTLWADLSKLSTTTSGTAQSLSVSIANAGDLSYYDGTSSSSILLNISPNIAPVTVVNIQGHPGGTLTAIVAQSIGSWWSAFIHLF